MNVTFGLDKQTKYFTIYYRKWIQDNWRK